METGLLTPNEVALYSAIDLPFNVCSFRELYSIEYRQGRAFLGYEFWQTMVAARADYSGKPAYQAGTTYSIGDIVSYKGVYYKATQVNDTLPTNTLNWEVAPKFDTAKDCSGSFESLWCNFLAYYLSNLVLAQRLPYIYSRVKDIGVVQYNGQDYDTVDDTAYDRLIRAIYRDVDLVKDNITHWINYSQDTVDDCFSDFAGILETENCNNEQKESRGASGGVPGGYDFG